VGLMARAIEAAAAPTWSALSRWHYAKVAQA
jgi:hypothetical protein